MIKASVRDGKIIIELPIDSIPLLFQEAIDNYQVDPGQQVVDPHRFARAMVRAMHRLDMWTSPLKEFIHEIFEHVAETGREGLEKL